METAQVTGRIADRTGKPIASAKVEVVLQSTGAVSKAQTSRQGIYNVPSLLPGTYTISVSASGFGPASRQITLPTGSRTRHNFRLEPGTTPAPQRAPLLNSETQTQQQTYTETQLRDSPNLTRNALQFSLLAGNLSDAGLGTRGIGAAINGQRESSTNILLDGVINTNLFAGSVGQPIPLDAVQELSVVTSGFTAELGRASGGIVSLVSKSGTSHFHGTAYEFNRVSALTSNSFKDNANGVKQQDFQRNQFGYSVGAPILRDKLFLFSSTEGTLVRSNATNFAWVPTSQLLARTAANTQSFFQTLGDLRPTTQSIGTVSLNDLIAIYGRNPCAGLACATLPTGIPLFNHVSYSVPQDSGGGYPQDAWNTLNRADYNLSDRTRLYARYSLFRESDQAGVLSSSPYNNYDLGQSQLSNTFAISATHTWAPQWVSQTKADFSRLNIYQQGTTSRGLVPSMYANPLAPVAIGSDNVAFPGYDPFAPGSGGAFGGPQNTFELHQDVSWTKANHLIRFGGSYNYIRDNRTDAAYQTAVDSLSYGGGIGTALNGLISGQFAQIQVAINPQGKFPCPAGSATAACALTLPLSSPNFSRSNRFQEGSLYAQDYWKPFRRIAVNLGVRWEHYGVQHSGNASLDSNWYASGVDFADDKLGAYLRNGGLQLASTSPTGKLWNSDWKDFEPRVGMAWDIFGNGRTVLRGGYGIGHERNFGNVTFNVIQNLPNYAVVDVAGPISSSNFGALAATGSLTLPQVGARIIDPQIKTAYAHFWSASLQRQVFRGVTYSADYSGSKGVNLYSISYPNQAGFGNFALGDPCTGNGDCFSQPNANYSENVGYRGNQGSSIYHGLNNRISANDIRGWGVSLSLTYTWSHAIDNISSTFFEAGGQGVASQYGAQNITINNGNFVTGLLDPYHPNLDRGDAEFDVRHRITLLGNWKVRPWKTSGWMGAALKGWSLNPIVTARSGQPFSVFDSSAQTLNLSTPRATFVGVVPHRRNYFVSAPTPDTIHLIRFSEASISSQRNLLTPGSNWPVNMSGRDAFRAPGFWNFDLALLKDTKITERFTLQLRGEAFNVFNHANLYIIGTSADVGRSDNVDACFGCSGSSYDRRQIQLGAKLIF